MLNNQQSMLLAAHKQAARESLEIIKRHPWHHAMTILVIALTLTLPVLLSIFVNNLSQFAGNWQEGGQITLYLKPGFNQETAASLLDFLKNNQLVEKYQFQSPEQGMETLMAQEGMANLQQYLPENPLPAAVEIVPAASIDTPEKLQLFFHELQKRPEVEQARLDKEWANRLHAIFTFSSTLTLILMGLLSLSVIVIIGNSLRLTIHSKKQNIQVLKLIGATDSFILRPYLYQGLGYGFLAALLAYALATGLLLSLSQVVRTVFLDYKITYSIQGLSLSQILILFGLASILGWCGAHLSVKRQLALIEPQ